MIRYVTSILKVLCRFRVIVNSDNKESYDVKKLQTALQTLATNNSTSLGVV